MNTSIDIKKPEEQINRKQGSFPAEWKSCVRFDIRQVLCITKRRRIRWASQGYGNTNIGELGGPYSVRDPKFLVVVLVQEIFGSDHKASTCWRLLPGQRPHAANCCSNGRGLS